MELETGMQEPEPKVGRGGGMCVRMGEEGATASWGGRLMRPPLISTIACSLKGIFRK